MNGETYDIGEKVKVYMVIGVVRGTVRSKKEVAIEIDDLHFTTTTLYLVDLDLGRTIFALEQFMGKVKQ